MYQIIKTTLLASTLLVMSFAPSTQGDIYAKYANKQGIVAFSFSKDMVDALDFDFDINDEIKYVKGDLSSIKFLSFSDESASLANALIADIEKEGYEKVDWKGDSEDELLLYVQRNGKRFSEIHFVKLNDETPRAMISFYGDITVKDHK